MLFHFGYHLFSVIVLLVLCVIHLCHSLCHLFYRYWLITGSSFCSVFSHSFIYSYLFTSYISDSDPWGFCHLARHYFPWKLFLRIAVSINIIKTIFNIFCRYISSHQPSLSITLYLTCIFFVYNLIKILENFIFRFSIIFILQLYTRKIFVILTHFVRVYFCIVFFYMLLFISNSIKLFAKFMLKVSGIYSLTGLWHTCI